MAAAQARRKAQPSEIKLAVESRFELFVTFLLDAAFLVGVILVRRLSIMALDAFSPAHAAGHEQSGVVALLEIVLDIGLLYAAIAMVAFDILKRVVRYGKALFSEFKK